ncbi:MAG: Ankyrin repeat (3 copies) [Rickettsiaceae bacterium]|jgi:hypothetical protein|nr:Ankyrin repeat (3 copies) [Rickettsiaceae bacterium]
MSYKDNIEGVYLELNAQIIDEANSEENIADHINNNDNESVFAQIERDIVISNEDFSFIVFDAIYDKRYSYEQLEEFIENGARINEVNFHGASALHYAAIEKDFEMFEFLLRKGANILIDGKFPITGHNLTSKKFPLQEFVIKPVNLIPLDWLYNKVMCLEYTDPNNSEDFNMLKALWNGVNFLLGKDIEEDEIFDKIELINHKLYQTLDALNPLYKAEDNYSPQEDSTDEFSLEIIDQESELSNAGVLSGLNEAL